MNSKFHSQNSRIESDINDMDLRVVSGFLEQEIKRDKEDFFFRMAVK